MATTDEHQWAFHQRWAVFEFRSPVNDHDGYDDADYIKLAHFPQIHPVVTKQTTADQPIFESTPWSLKKLP